MTQDTINCNLKDKKGFIKTIVTTLLLVMLMIGALFIVPNYIQSRGYTKVETIIHNNKEYSIYVCKDNINVFIVYSSYYTEEQFLVITGDTLQKNIKAVKDKYLRKLSKEEKVVGQIHKYLLKEKVITKNLY